MLSNLMVVDFPNHRTWHSISVHSHSSADVNSLKVEVCLAWSKFTLAICNQSVTKAEEHLISLFNSDYRMHGFEHKAKANKSIATTMTVIQEHNRHGPGSLVIHEFDVHQENTWRDLSEL